MLGIGGIKINHVFQASRRNETQNVLGIVAVGVDNTETLVVINIT